MELIHIQQTIIGKGAVNSVNARELHAKLEIKSRFNDWIANRLSDFIENEDYIVVTKNLVTEVSSYMEIPRLQFADALHFVQNISMEDLV